MLGDGKHVCFENGEWKCDEVLLNKTYCAVANAGATGQRIIPWTVWQPHPHGINSQLQPYILNGDKYDLSTFNTWYFPIVQKIIQIAQKFDIKTWFCLADNCQFHGDYRKWSPWVTNVNGVTTIFQPAAYPYFKAWIKKCIAELGPLGVGWIWGNEMQPQAMRELAAFCIHPFYNSGQMAFSNSAYGAVMKDAPYVRGEYVGNAGVLDDLKADVGEKYGDAAKLAIWKEVHGCGKRGDNALIPPNRIDQALYWWARKRNNGIRIWLSDDGVKDGTSACDRDTDGARTSSEMWFQIVKLACQYANDFVFEHLPQSSDLACQTNTLKEIYRAIHGEYPTEKYHYDPPIPPTPPEPEPPEPEPPEPEKSWWLQIWEWIKRIFR